MITPSPTPLVDCSVPLEQRLDNFRAVLASLAELRYRPDHALDPEFRNWCEGRRDAYVVALGYFDRMFYTDASGGEWAKAETPAYEQPALL